MVVFDGYIGLGCATSAWDRTKTTTLWATTEDSPFSVVFILTCGARWVGSMPKGSSVRVWCSWFLATVRYGGWKVLRHSCLPFQIHVVRSRLRLCDCDGETSQFQPRLNQNQFMTWLVFKFFDWRIKRLIKRLTACIPLRHLLNCIRTSPLLRSEAISFPLNLKALSNLDTPGQKRLSFWDTALLLDTYKPACRAQREVDGTALHRLRFLVPPCRKK